MQLSDGSSTGPITCLVPLPVHGKAAGAPPPPPESDIARSFFFQDGTPKELDGLFVMGCLSGVYLCRAVPDQRLQHLHTVMPPAGIREDAPPYAAWQAVQHDAQGYESACNESAWCTYPVRLLRVTSLLAVCWEHHVVVLLVPVAAQQGDTAEGSGALWGRVPSRGGSRDLKETPRGEPPHPVPHGGSRGQ